MLRYYEERGLLAPQRAPSGYRHYQESDIDRATLVSSLIRSGLPTRLIIPLLDKQNPISQHQTGDTDNSDDELATLFTAELARLNSRIACLTLSRDAVRRHVRRARTSPANQEPTTP
jgi:DNA-binding transcriptional MerR regulator